MKENKASRLRELTADEVRQKIREFHDELFHLRFRNSVKQLDNPLRIREVRRDLARMVTLLHEHEKGIHALGVQKDASK